MKSKKFIYVHKDVKQLKIDIAFRILFSALFLGIFVWQFTAMVMYIVKNKFSNVHGVVAAIVLISSLLLCLITFFYAFKDFQIIAAVKMSGQCVSSVSILFSTRNNSFIRLYNYLIQFLTLATTLVLIAALTYTILQITVLSTISFYMPLLLMICVSGYNSIYHIKDEIRTQETVQEQTPLY